MNALIMWGLTIWVPILLYVLNINEAKFKKNLAVGVTFPLKGRADPEVLGLLRGFRREQIVLCLALVALGVLCGALSWPELRFLPYFLWLDLVIVAQFVSYARWNGKLKAVKRAKGWTMPTVRAASVTVPAAPAKRPGLWWFIAAAAAGLAPAAFDRALWYMYLLDGATAFACYFGSRYLYRNRAEAVDENDAVTQALTRVRRRAWDQVWVLCAWMMAVISICIFMSTRLPSGGGAMMLATVVLALAVCAVAIALEFRVRRVQEKLTASSGEGFYVDEDDKWIWGQIYYDPNDSRTVINNRTGANSTVNLARPGGKALLAFSLALLFIAMPVMGVCFDSMGGGPELVIEDGALVAASWGKDYVLPLEEIKSAEIIDALPKNGVRVMGIGLDSFLKGRFKFDGGDATLCLDPRTGPWLKVTMADGTLYLLGGGESGAEAVFTQMKG